MRRIGIAITIWLGLPGAALAQTAPTPLLDEPALFTKAMAKFETVVGDDSHEPRDGLYPELGGMIPGGGWISAGPGYRRNLFGRRAFVDASAAISWRAYKFAQARLEFPSLASRRLTLGSQVLWHDYTQVRYYGLGPTSLEADASDYRVQATTAVGYATWRPRPALAISANAGVVSRPELSASAGTFDQEYADTLQRHAGVPAAALPRQPRFVHAELSVTADTRDQPSYPSRGSVLRAAWSTYHDRPDTSLAFDRYEAEAAYFKPLLGRGVLATRAWGVFSNTGDGHAVPFYFMPGLGGHNTLRGYADYRFRDRHMVVVNLETRWALFTHLDLAGFFDAGNVASRLHDLNFDRTSAGVGVRFRTSTSMMARLDVARSVEGWRVMFKLSDPFQMERVNKRTAPLPFVP